MTENNATTIRKRGAIASRLCNLLLTELLFFWSILWPPAFLPLRKRNRLRSQSDIATFGEEYETFPLHVLLPKASIEYPSRVRERPSLCLQFE
jgi:hypothetical protein